MAVIKPNVQPRRPLPSQASPTDHGKVRVGNTIGERRVQAAPKAVARQVMAHKKANALPRSNANYVAGRLESPLTKITKTAPSIGPGRITTAGALGILDFYFPSAKKTA